MSNTIGSDVAYRLNSALPDDDDGPKVVNPDDEATMQQPAGASTSAVGDEDDPWAV